MGVDNKYGRVTLEYGTIGNDEPVVVFRANDIILPKVLMYYHLFCLKEGAPDRHLSMILKSLDRVKAWQKKYPTAKHMPNSQSSLDWMD